MELSSPSGQLLPLPTAPLPVVHAPPSKNVSEDTILVVPYADDQLVSTQLSKKKRQSPIRFCCCLPVSNGVWVLSLTLMVPCIAIIFCFWVADLRRVIRFNVPYQTRIVYTVIYSLYFLLGVAIGFIVQRRLPFERYRPLISIYWILISATILEGIYFGVLMSKQKAKLITFCDPTLPSIQPLPPPNTGSNSTVPLAGEKPITCRHEQNSIIGALYIIGPAGWLVLHVGWILMTALLCKALRVLYASSPALYMASLPKHHRQHTNQRISNPEHVASRPFDPTMGPTQHLHASHVIDPVREGELIHTPHYDDQHLRRPSPGFRHALEQSYLSMKSKLSKRRSVDPPNSQFEATEAAYEPSSDDEDDDEDPGTYHGVHVMGGSGVSHQGSQSSNGSLPNAGKLPAVLDGKGWWIRQLEAKRRGEFCPCTDEDGRHLPEPIEGCWCGRPRVVHV
ncbi:hypothetical protein DFQ26_008736 [Actinomortierella ambigua]|nr:hypothetical protein DFQ26_008736 [Actinomortierella ambigua]